MPRYEIRAIADLEPGSAPDLDRLRGLTGGDIAFVGEDLMSVVVIVDAADLDRLTRGLIDAMQDVTRCGIWTARRLGVLSLGRRRNGSWSGRGDDDGLGGVREPRRPIPPAGSASAALDLPAA